jgi:hypothetical protein
MQTKPSATIAITIAAATSSNSAIAARPAHGPDQKRFIRSELRYYRLLNVEAMDENSPALVRPGWHGARQQAHQRSAGIPRRTQGQAHGIDHEAGVYWKSGVEGSPRNIHSGDHGLTQEAKRELS